MPSFPCLPGETECCRAIRAEQACLPCVNLKTELLHPEEPIPSTPLVQQKAPPSPTSAFPCSHPLPERHLPCLHRPSPCGLLGQHGHIGDDKVLELVALLLPAVLHRVVVRQWCPKEDFTPQQGAFHVLGRQALIHIPVEFRVGHGQLQGPCGRKQRHFS